MVSALALAAAPLTQADEILLRGGGRISGVVVEKTDRTITIETGPGQVTLPLSLVEKVVDGRSVIETWQERSTSLASSDAPGWAALARWAEAQSLVTQARAAWQRVLTVDPQNAEANAALGRVQMDGTWLGREEAYRAQGLVPFEGRWVSRAEHDALLQQQVAENAAARSEREAEVRLREAEARAREAEARAREAENAVEDSSDGSDGIPIWAVGFGSDDDGHRGPRRRRRDRDEDRHRPRPEPQPTPVPTPPPSRLGPTHPPRTGQSHPGVPSRDSSLR